MANMAGYAGQFLEVNLTSRTSRTVPLDPRLARDFIGGRALGTRMLLDEYGSRWADIDPLGPEAVFLVVQGPLNAYCAGKTNGVFMSPLNGSVMASQVSGDFNAEIRLAGYDGIIVRGRADTPVYVYIKDDQVEIRDARDLWGMDTRETHRTLAADTDGATQFLYIGPAGEKQVKIASVMTNWYKAMGRGGSGAIWGSKNLKAIAVRGTKPAPDVADLAGMRRLIRVLAREAPVRSVGSHEYGTTRGIYGTGFRSSEPVRNWQGEWHDEKQIQGEFFAAEQWTRRYWADYACTLACCKIGRIKEGQYAGEISELPDYEGGAFVGPNFGIYNINDIPHLCDVYDRAGIDHISGGTVVSWAAELYQRGILTRADLGGADLTWGNVEAFEEIITKLANREGIGDTLAEGTYGAAKLIGNGSMRYVMHVKGIEYGAHGVRAAGGGDRIARYALGTQGGDHCSTAGPTYEQAYFNDVLVLCGFWSVTDEEELEFLNVATGFGITQEELENVLLPRWATQQWVPLVLAGWTHKDTTNAPRCYEPLPSGPYKGNRVDKAKEQKLVQEAYAARGYDRLGIPTSEGLEKHGLSNLDDLVRPFRGRRSA